ncbi:MAG TPA: ABC transporter permease [Gemmataceae bacterium]|jgi:lipopolysaccharide transport system permease protein|nr:ABC transporter permease [Gemmataceae bacterium]
MSSVNRTVIEAGRVERQYWQDLWRYRELLFFLSWRDVAVRYKQTAIGIAWAVIRPVATVTVFVVVFGRIAKLPSDGVPYPLLVLAGMLAWQLFATGFTSAGDSLVGSSNLISKVYFPRLLVPMSAVAVSCVDFVVTLPVLLVLMVWYGIMPTWRFLLFPGFVLLTIASAMAVGIWLAALNVRYRDFRFITPFVVQFGVYVTPVGFSSAAVPDQYWILFALNPLTAIIEGFRWSLLGRADGFNLVSLTLSVLATGVLLTTGIRYFRRTERTIVDVI